MIQVEYVMSALGWGVIPNSFMKFPHLEEFKVAMLEVGNLLNRNVAEKCQSTIPKISTLFNAFTEEDKVKEIQELNRMGFPLLRKGLPDWLFYIITWPAAILLTCACHRSGSE